MKRLLIIVLILIFNSTYGQSLKLLSIEEQMEDIAFIKKELLALHPGVYTYQTEVEFENRFNSLTKNLKPKQTVFQFYNSLIPTINEIGCGHTTAKLPSKELKKIQKNRMFIPLEIKIINDKIIITKAFINHPFLIPGNEIISINGISTKDYISSNLNRYPSDGRILSRKYQSMEKNFSLDLALFNYTSEEYIIRVLDKGKIKTISLAGINYEDKIANTKPSQPKGLELQIIDSISTAILTFKNSGSKKIYQSFLEKSFEKILTKKVNNLVIDVRYDSFNRDSDGADLYAYLTNEPFNYYKALEVTENYDVPKAIRWATHYPIEKDSLGNFYWKIHPQLEQQKAMTNPFLGNIYVLTDGFTFSATSEFSSIVKSNKRGLIVGRETGGGYYGNNSGGMQRAFLPNSDIKVYIPPIKYHLAVNELENYSKGVIPDIKVNENIKDILLQKDVILNTAIQLIITEDN